MRALILYYSKSGTTKKMAELIADFIKKEGVKVDICDSQNFQVKKMLDYDAIVAGSPTYYGAMAGVLKKIFDESVAFHGSLDGKIGAAFTTAANIAGGNETTILNILQVMLIHGMLIQGDYKGDHYGPVAIGKIDYRTEQNCQRYAQRLAKLLKKIHKK